MVYLPNIISGGTFSSPTGLKSYDRSTANIGSDTKWIVWNYVDFGCRLTHHIAPNTAFVKPRICSIVGIHCHFRNGYFKLIYTI